MWDNIKEFFPKFKVNIVQILLISCLVIVFVGSIIMEIKEQKKEISQYEYDELTKYAKEDIYIKGIINKSMDDNKIGKSEYYSILDQIQFYYNEKSKSALNSVLETK